MASKSATTDPTTEPAKTIAFQGAAGAYSDLACRTVYPDMTPLACTSFEDTFAAVEDGRASLAMLPIENSEAGRVADIHMLLPHTTLHIVGEHFQRVRHCLLASPQATLASLKRVYSHVQALSQCRAAIRALGLVPVATIDTAAAAAEVAERGDASEAAIASELAADLYKLTVLKRDMEDAERNTTRFVLLARDAIAPEPDVPTGQDKRITSFIFSVRNVPAALYKALGGFATNGVNMLKVESYMVDGSFTSTQFYAEIEGHPEQKNVQLAFDELRFISREVKVLGVYRADPFREN
ncbi:MAG: prephenate dehydratase [Rhodospirillaceae bacterium]|nr:MAG: prephenate dehydratase [Rhodospirillaceae bacterium]